MQQVPEVSEEVHKMIVSIAKILIGLGVVGAIVAYTPIFDLLYVFFYLVLIPTFFLAALGIISSSTVNLFIVGLPEIKRRVQEQRLLLEHA